MNTVNNCERIRIALMAALDGEGSVDADLQHHLSACETCHLWMQNARALNERLQGLQYEDDWNSQWPAIAPRIRESGTGPALPRGLAAIVVALAVWRVLQLSIDVPIPIHVFISAAATLGVVWLAAHSLLKIQTWAPELRK